MIAPEPAEALERLVQEVLNCPPGQIEAWIAEQRPQLTFALIQALKNYTVAQTVKAPKAIDSLTRNTLVIATQLPDEPLAMPLADWARGFWEMYNAPQRAIHSFGRALTGYRQANDPISVASLLTNLIYTFAVCGRFAEGEAAYQEALPTFLACQEDAPFRLMRLQQNYGVLLEAQGKYEHALATYQAVHKLALANDNPVVAAEMLVNCVFSLMLLGRSAECEALLLAARTAALTEEQTLTVARIDMNLGMIHTALGQPAAALRWFQSAQQKFAAEQNLMEVGSVAMRKGLLFTHIGAWRAARRSYREAQAAFTEHQLWPEVGQAQIQLATLQRAAGEFKQAEKGLNEAETNWRQLQHSFWLTVVKLERIALLLAQQKPGEASALLTAPLPVADNQALTMQHALYQAEAWRQQGDAAGRVEAQAAYMRVIAYAQAQNHRWLQRQALAGLGQLLLDVDPVQGCAFLESAVALDEQTRQKLSVEELKASFQAQSSDLLPLLVRTAVDSQQPLRGLGYIWRTKCGAFADLLAGIGTAETEAEPINTEIQQLRQQIAAQRWVVANQPTADPGVNAYTTGDYTTGQKTLAELEKQLSDLRWGRNREQTNNLDQLFAAPLRLLATLEADGLLEYMVCDDRLVGIIATRAGNCQAVWLGTVDAVLNLYDELQLVLKNGATQPRQHHLAYAEQWRAEYEPLLHSAYKLLVAPLLALIDPLPVEAHLLIAPCDPLFLLPFAAFWDGAHYLTERYCLEMVPSGGMLALPPAPAATTLRPPLIIASTAGGAFLGIRTEAESVAHMLGSAPLIDQPNSIDYLRQGAPPEQLHIAAHSLLRDDAPIFSALQLTDEVLTVEQCYELPLAGTTLVALVGCTTGTGQDSGGALLAFQSAFLIAGAQCVLSSLWPISDPATADWMRHFYRFRRQGHAPYQALRLTQLALLQEPHHRHPALWAPFVCTRR